MKFILMACLILTALPIEAGTDSPASDLRCGVYIISRGARQSEVLRKCGSPSNIETWEQERIKRDFYQDIPAQSEEQLSQEPLFLREQIVVEEWEYNFGPARFIYYLRFENGRLRRITVGDYGY
jgi:hypothetical protein